MVAAPCPPLRACNATSRTRSADIQDKEEDVLQLQSEACLGLCNLAVLTLNISDPYPTPTSCISVDAASPNSKCGSKRWDFSAGILPIPRTMRAESRFAGQIQLQGIS